METKEITVYQTINGWTKESMIKHIKDNFRGKSLGRVHSHRYKTCVYKNPEGRRCAVGMFIPHTEYESKMNYAGVASDLLITFPDLRQYMPLMDAELTELQQAHDASDATDTLDDMLKWINKNVGETK